VLQLLIVRGKTDIVITSPGGATLRIKLLPHKTRNQIHLGFDGDRKDFQIHREKVEAINGNK